MAIALPTYKTLFIRCQGLPVSGLMFSNKVAIGQAKLGVGATSGQIVTYTFDVDCSYDDGIGFILCM